MNNETVNLFSRMICDIYKIRLKDYLYKKCLIDAHSLPCMQVSSCGLDVSYLSLNYIIQTILVVLGNVCTLLAIKKRFL